MILKHLKCLLYCTIVVDSLEGRDSVSFYSPFSPHIYTLSSTFIEWMRYQSRQREYSQTAFKGLMDRGINQILTEQAFNKLGGWMNQGVCGMPGAMLGELPFISAGFYSLQSSFTCDPGSEDQWGSLCQSARILLSFLYSQKRDVVPKVPFVQGYLVKYPSFSFCLPNILLFSF